MNRMLKHKMFICCLAVIMLPPALYAQDTLQIKATGTQLSAKQRTVNHVLADTSLMKLHSLIPFRELVKKHAIAGTLIPVTANEPGPRIKVTGTIMDAAGAAVPGALVYIYQTDARGYYADTGIHIRINEGDRRHARLFGYLLTDAKGQFTIETIKPGGYPGSVLPAHIHFEAFLNGKSIITELRFDDDPRLTPQQRLQSEREGFYIAKPSGTKEKPVYNHIILFRY